MKKQVISTVLSATMVAAMVAGCGSSSTTTSTASETASTEAASETASTEAASSEAASEAASTTAAASDFTGTIRWLNYKPEIADPLVEVAKEYTNETGVDVQVDVFLNQPVIRRFLVVVIFVVFHILQDILRTAVL